MIVNSNKSQFNFLIFKFQDFWLAAILVHIVLNGKAVFNMKHRCKKCLKQRIALACLRKKRLSSHQVGCLNQSLYFTSVLKVVGLAVSYMILIRLGSDVICKRRIILICVMLDHVANIITRKLKIV